MLVNTEKNIIKSLCLARSLHSGSKSLFLLLHLLHRVLNATKYTACWKMTSPSNVKQFNWREKPEDLVAGGCRRSSVEQHSSLF